MTEPRTARARAPDPDSPSRKNTAGDRCGREAEKISTPLEKPPCPVTDDRQILTPRRTRQPAKPSPTDAAAYFPVTANQFVFGPVLGLMVPLPSKFRIRVLPPVFFDAEPNQERYNRSQVMEYAERIRTQIQEAVYEMLRNRRSVWFG